MIMKNSGVALSCGKGKEPSFHEEVDRGHWELVNCAILTSAALTAITTATSRSITTSLTG